MPAGIVDDGEKKKTVSWATVDVEKVTIALVATLFAKIFLPASRFGGPQRNHVHMAKDCGTFIQAVAPEYSSLRIDARHGFPLIEIGDQLGYIQIICCELGVDEAGRLRRLSHNGRCQLRVRLDFGADGSPRNWRRASATEKPFVDVKAP